MRHFRPTLRHLYLLALFQLVGGPLVVLAVIGFSKVVVHHAAVHGVPLGVKQAIQSSEWQELADALAGRQSAPPASKAPEQEKVPQSKESQGKLFFAAWERQLAPLREISAQAWFFPHLECLVPAWAHAPPSPPPRAV